jgi:ketosteroid isomerase-like protein
MTDFVDRFIAALHHLEEAGDTSRIVPLFAADASIANPLVRHDQGGPDAAKQFWSAYRAAFGEIRSEFRHVAEADGAAFLEWVSEGTTAKGEGFRYGGVSVLEHDGESISAFRTYFDPRQISG